MFLHPEAAMGVEGAAGKSGNVCIAIWKISNEYEPAETAAPEQMGVRHSVVIDRLPKMNKTPGASVPGAGSSIDSFPWFFSATAASAAPGFLTLTAPALSNRPLYQSWG